MNVMVCPRCGQPVNPAVAKCPHCGQPLRVAAPTVTNIANATLATGALQNAYAEQKRKSMIIGIVVAVIAILGAIGYGLHARSLQASAQGDDGRAMLTHGAKPGKVLAENAHAPVPMMDEPAQQNPNPQMPDDVYQWLKHLEKCEQIKTDIANDQMADVMVLTQKMQTLGAGMGMLDPYEQEKSDQTGNDDNQAPGQYAKGKVMDFRPKWLELQQFYRSKTPPAECQKMADDYGRALNEIPGMMGDLGDILNGADADPASMLKKVEKMQSSSYGDIDRYFARTDNGLSDICAKYKVNKWFNVKADIASGGIMGKFGGLSGAGGLGAGLGGGLGGGVGAGGVSPGSLGGQ